MSCTHILLRGPRSGEACGAVCTHQVYPYCTRHIRSRERTENGMAELTSLDMLRELMDGMLPNNEVQNVIEDSQPRYERPVRIIPREFRAPIREHYEYKQPEISTCMLCSDGINGPNVNLECTCKYHLKCYLLIQCEEKCFGCGDKIHKEEEDYPECSICMEKIKMNENETTRCKHTFHKHCIGQWKHMGNNSCPNCRSTM